MEKKRKRASFSISAEPPKPSEKVIEAVQDDPTVKQVVEVVVQDRTHSGKAPHINIVIPQPQAPQPKIDADVAKAVNSMPNLIDDGTDEETPLPQKHQHILTEVVQEDEETEEPESVSRYQTVEEVPEDDEADEDDSVVTASATPQGDTVVVRKDPEYEEEEPVPAPSHKRIVIEDEVADEEEDLPEEEPKKPPVMKIHTNGNHGMQSNAEREEAVAELFGNNNQSVMPEITVHKHAHTKGIILWALTMVAVALGVGGGLVLFTNRYNQPSSPAVPANPTAAVATTPSVLPTATPTPVAVKRSEIRIQVLNGGGKAGAGSRMKAFLEEKGYRVVETRNADSYTYETTEIVVKESKADIIDTLAKDLEESYELGESKTDLPESSTYDARVVVGENE